MANFSVSKILNFRMLFDTAVLTRKTLIEMLSVGLFLDEAKFISIAKT